MKTSDTIKAMVNTHPVSTLILEDRVTARAVGIGIDEHMWQKFMAKLFELKVHNEFMYAHSLRVGLYTLGIAEYEHQTDLHFPLFAGCGHDIGKRDVSNDLLDSTDLKPHEFEIIKNHSKSGFDALKDEFLWAACVAGLHHKFKSGGYGIEFDQVATQTLTEANKYQIRTMAELVMMADFFDALTTRPDNKGFIADPHNTVLQQQVMAAHFPDAVSRAQWLIANRIMI